MPLFAAVGAGLAAIGGGSAAVGAGVAAGALGAGATIYGANKAASASGKGANAQVQAANATIAEQQRQYDLTRADNEPFRQIGLSSAQAMASSFGLPVSMTGGSAPVSAPQSAVPTTPAGVSMTGSKTGIAGVSPAVPDTGMGVGVPAAPAAAPAAAPGQPDWAQVLKDRPDVLAEYQRASSTADRHSPVFMQKGLDSPEHFAQYWYNNLRGAAGDTYRAPLTPSATQAPAPAPAPAATPSDGAYKAPPGYTDPTAPTGYTSPARPTMAPLNVSEAEYQKSPGYDFRLSEGLKSLDHVASAGGGIMSGARLKAATRYGQDYATNDYTNWRDYTTGEYNADRARSDGLYQDDRSFTTGRYDQRNSQLMQLAGFGTGANASNAAAGQSYAANVGNATMAAGNARAGGYINGANAVNSGVNNLMTAGTYLAGKYMGGGTPGVGYGSNGGYAGYKPGDYVGG